LTAVNGINEGIWMAHLLYVSASLGDLERAKRAIARAKQAGWTITFDWTKEAVYRAAADCGITFSSRARAREVSEEWLRGVQQCDTFLMLASVPASRGRERELGAALAFNLVGVGSRRVIVANREYKRADLAAPSPTAWDGQLEIFDTDEEALVALGNAELPVLDYPGTGVAELLVATGSRRPEDLVGKTIRVSLREPKLKDFVSTDESPSKDEPLNTECFRGTEPFVTPSAASGAQETQQACQEMQQQTRPKEAKHRVQQVVSALFFDHEGRVYLQRREPNKRFPLLWDLPGGKVEEGETPEEALLREIREELGPDLHRHCVGDLIATYDVLLERPYHLSLYGILLPYPERVLVTDAHHRWVQPLEAVQQLACVPSLYAWYEAITRYWERLNSPKRSLLAYRWVQQAQKAMGAPDTTAWSRIQEIQQGLSDCLGSSDPFWQNWHPFFQEVKGRFPLSGELQATATIAVAEHYSKVRHRRPEDTEAYLRSLLSAPHADLNTLANLAERTVAELALAVFHLQKEAK
jgi:8-oxo-dGTP diphosphatase